MTSLVSDHPHCDTSTDAGLLARTMQPYVGKGAAYLSDPHVRIVDGVLTGTGRFCIPEPCYIDETGHFNAAEFVICYNQLMYYTLAAAVRDGLSSHFAHWTLDEYWAKQLPDVLITSLDSKFSRPIASAGFTGEFTIAAAQERTTSRRILFLDTTIGFSDDQGGCAEGNVRLAVIEPPARA